MVHFTLLINLFAMDLKIDFVSFVVACAISSLGMYLIRIRNVDEYLLRFLLRWLVRLQCVQVPKTSNLMELNNKPLKKIKQSFFTDTKDMEETLQKINRDPNLKYYGVNRDISVILRCLYDDKEELLVDTMDNIVISKQGIEILIYKFEKPDVDEKFDRSILIDIAHYRNVVFNLHGALVFLFFIIGFVIGGTNDLRAIWTKLN